MCVFYAINISRTKFSEKMIKFSKKKAPLNSEQMTIYIAMDNDFRLVESEGNLEKGWGKIVIPSLLLNSKSFNRTSITAIEFASKGRWRKEISPPGPVLQRPRTTCRGGGRLED